jgi:centromere protein J
MYVQIFPDSRTVVRFSNGDVKTSVPSTGTVMYYYAAAKTTQTSFKDGLEVFEFPSGQV